MDTTTVTISVILIFALLVIIAFIRFRQRGGAEISGPFGTKLKIDGSNDPPGQKASITAKGITSREGGVLAEETLGRGIEAENVDAKQDILLSSSYSPQPVSKLPSIDEASISPILSAQGLAAGGNITIQQFVGNQIPPVEQIEFFLKHIGLENMRVNRFANAQFEAYAGVWKNLQALRLLGDDLWEKADSQNLLRFAEQWRKTLSLAREGEIFFDDLDRRALLDILKEFGEFRLGKHNLIQIRNDQEYEGGLNFEDYVRKRELNEQWVSEAIADQVRKNYRYKIRYEALLEKIRISFRKRLSH